MGSTFPVIKGAISSLMHRRARFGARCRTAGYILIMRFDRLSRLQVYSAHTEQKDEYVSIYFCFCGADVFEHLRI